MTDLDDLLTRATPDDHRPVSDWGIIAGGLVSAAMCVAALHWAGWL